MQSLKRKTELKLEYWRIFTQPPKRSNISLQWAIFVQSIWGFNRLKQHRGVIFHETEQWCKLWLNADPVVTKMGWGIGWTCPTPIGLRPGFLSSGIYLHERKASVVWVSIRSVDSFWKKMFGNSFWRLLLGVPKLFDASIFCQSSKFMTEGLDPPFLLIASLLMSSSYIDSNQTRWNFSSGPWIKIFWDTAVLQIP